MNYEFLATSKKDMKHKGISQFDFVYVLGDAYVDHPSFGVAIITRLLEKHGFSVGIIAQPDWRNDESITILGEPRLAFLVSSGNVDSMVNHYTVNKKKRSEDVYSPGGKSGHRPDRAVIVYSNLIRKTYKKTAIILGGIEASLRRLAHYDYWSNRVKRSILLDSGADLISYGMGEHSIIEIAECLDSGLDIADITYIAGTVCKAKTLDAFYEPILLPTYEEVANDTSKYADSFYLQYQNTDPFTARILVEAYDGQGYIVQNPPAKPLTTREMDDIYALDYTRAYHPMYNDKGGVPAFKEVQFSLTANRGCFGNCSFCALSFHQGRIVQNRSEESLIQEALTYTQDVSFKGFIHDVGGPTANFTHPACKRQLKSGVCKNKQCLYPKPCKELDTSHAAYVALLRKLRALPKIKKVFIRSGIRFDYLLADKSDTFLNELVEHHVSGQLRVAPEHVTDKVLKIMGKPIHQVYQDFVHKFNACDKKIGKRQYVVPYFMSSHPGSTLRDAVELAEYIRDMNFMPEQVQDFYPTPSTLSTCMYYTGINPITKERVYVPKSAHEKAMQRALMRFKAPQNYDLVVEALKKVGRMDLIGFGERCLVRPRRVEKGNGKGNNVKGRGVKKKLKRAIRNVHKKGGGV